MNKSLLIAPLMLLVLTAPVARAQEGRVPESSAETSSAQSQTTLKVQIVITEYSGTQKVSNLPYTIYIVDSGNHPNQGSVRMGTKVPIRTGSFKTPNDTISDQYTYQDVGTNIDCRLVAPTGTDGRYHLTFSIERSSVVSSTGSDIKPGEAIPTGQPLIRNFQDSFDVVLRDGQTLEGSSSVDPATGNVMKVDVTLNVEK